MMAMARTTRDDAIVLFDIVDNLLGEKLYHSAEIVGGILLSRASISQIGGLHAEALSMFADALKGRGEHKRATVRRAWRQVDRRTVHGRTVATLHLVR